MILIVMGVQGSGKTTVGSLLARRLGWEFLDADDLHPATNRDKMAAGLALNDEDRRPWLQALHERILSWDKNGTAAVLACSALKRSYRDLLAGNSRVDWIYLKGEPKLVEERLKDRQDHFAKADLLTSQFETLEEPAQALWIDIQEEPGMIVERIVRWVEERR